MKKIIMYTGPMCAFCDAAKRLLKRNNANFEEIDIGTNLEIREEMIKKSNGRRTVPQIFVGDKHIGGYEELRALEKNSELNNVEVAGVVIN